jgi:hypothetical protein
MDVEDRHRGRKRRPWCCHGRDCEPFAMNQRPPYSAGPTETARVQVAGENGSVSARFKLAFAASANEHALCSGDGELERGAGALVRAGTHRAPRY